MGDLLFFVKTIIFTAILVVFLQVKIGDITLEDQFMGWVNESSVIQPLQKVADGGVLVLRDAWQKITGSINTKFSRSVEEKNKPGNRSLGIKLERSSSYNKAQSSSVPENSEEEAY